MKNFRKIIEPFWRQDSNFLFSFSKYDIDIEESMHVYQALAAVWAALWTAWRPPARGGRCRGPTHRSRRACSNLFLKEYIKN